MGDSVRVAPQRQHTGKRTAFTFRTILRDVLTRLCSLNSGAANVRKVTAVYSANIATDGRDLQLEARDKGRPWDMGKGFDRSAVIGPVHPAEAVGHPDTGSIRLTVNGETKQDANLAELIWSVPEIVSILSQSVTLQPGDVIMTGTPAGVGPLVEGDKCVVSIEGLGEITTIIGPRA